MGATGGMCGGGGGEKCNGDGCYEYYLGAMARARDSAFPAQFPVQPSTIHASRPQTTDIISYYH